MKADENKLKTMAITLRWETGYRKGEYRAGTGAFLPELNTLDRDFAEAIRLVGADQGELLEIGAGLGTQAVCYAQLGFSVTAIDVSPTAVETAGKKTAEFEFNTGSLKFVLDNILMTKLQPAFDIIADRGCYATLKAWELVDYCRHVRQLLKPEGVFLLKVNAGQRKRVEPLETCFRIVESYDTCYQGEVRQGPPAIFFILKPHDKTA